MHESKARHMPAVVFASTFLIVALCRLLYVKYFVVALPFWDQWDAEGNSLLKHWVNGTFHYRQLWDVHNEHRILPTRLLSIAIFSITHEWNNLTEARVNVFLTALIPAFLVCNLYKKNKIEGIKWLVPLVIISQFILPFPFENFLVGFQSQFYFLLLFTILAISLAACSPDNWPARFTTLLLSLLCVLTMASGLITPIVVALVYLLQWLIVRPGSRSGYVICLPLIGLAVFGYKIIPAIDSTVHLRAQNLQEFIATATLIGGFPFRHDNWAAILWLPGLTAIALFFIKKSFTKTDFLMAGCLGWSLAQIFAIAYGRGHDMTSVSSRYTELVTPGIIANAWFALRLAEHLPKVWSKWLVFVFFTLVAVGHQTRYRWDRRAVKETFRRSLLQVDNVKAYLLTKDPSVLDKPQFEIPYPDAGRLQSYLDDPTLKSILPRELGPARKHADIKKGVR